MKKILVFIDDSGDPGFKGPASSDFFIMAAVVIHDPKIAETLMQEIKEYRKFLGWRYNHEFKFNKNPKQAIEGLLQRICKYEFDVYAVYIDKKQFYGFNPQRLLLSNHDHLYNWLVCQLLLNIPLNNAKVTIDGHSSKANMKVFSTYLRRELNYAGKKKITIKFEDSISTDLLQMADLVVGSIARSLKVGKTDSKKYIQYLKNNIIEIDKL